MRPLSLVLLLSLPGIALGQAVQRGPHSAFRPAHGAISSGDGSSQYIIDLRPIPLGCVPTGMSIGTGATKTTLTVSRASTKTCPLTSGEITCQANELCNTEQGAYIEWTATQAYPTPTVPAAATTGSLATGTWTFWCEGTGSQAISAGTAVGTGWGTSSNGSVVTVSITSAGTATLGSVTGSLTRCQLENSPWKTSFIAAVGSRAGDNVSVPIPSTLPLDQFCVSAHVAPENGRGWGVTRQTLPFSLGTQAANNSAWLTGGLTWSVRDATSTKAIGTTLGLAAGSAHDVMTEVQGGVVDYFVDGYRKPWGTRTGSGAGFAARPTTLWIGSGNNQNWLDGYVNALRVSARPCMGRPVALKALVLGDSIFNDGPFQNLATSNTYLYVPDLVGNVLTLSEAKGAFSGEQVGHGLLELADEVYAYESGAWALKTRGEAFSAYGAVVWNWGANDAGGSLDFYTKGYDKLFHQAVKAGIPIVCASGPPPQAQVGLGAWTASGGYEFGGFYAAAKAAATRWGATYVDQVANFRALTTAGTYTVAQLMGDTVHPSTIIGAQAESPGLASCLLGQKAITNPTATPLLAGKVRVELFGEPTVGSWTITDLSASSTNELNRIAGYDTGKEKALCTSGSVGSTVTFRATTSSQTWACHSTKSTGGGTLDLVVDGSTWATVDTTTGVADNLRCLPVTNDSSPTEHTISWVTKDTSPACVLATVYVGVP